MRNQARLASIVAALTVLVLLAGCSVHESRSPDQKEKKVSIDTPIGGMKINAGAEVDTGIPLYPGAKPKPKDEHSDHSANVNIDTAWFGMKLAVAEYVSEDAPDKVLGFYRDKLKTFGAVVECDGSNYISIHPKGDGSYPKDANAPVTCDDSGHGNATELKVGVRSKQRVVAVKTTGNGTEFALVYLQTHGREGSL